MPDDWVEVSSPRERVRTIAESMQGSRTSEWVAEQAEVDDGVARDVLEEMVDVGELITWTRECEQVYALNEGRQLVDYLRDIGVETDEGILIPTEVVNELESSRPRYDDDPRDTGIDTPPMDEFLTENQSADEL